MSKNVRKTLKLLKISHPHPGWKKVTNSSAGAENKKSKFKGLKKFIPKMGNFTSHQRQQQTIENVDEHATKVMTQLTEMRNKEISCDVTFSSKDLAPAHGIVVSFNQTLLEIAESSTEAVSITIEADEATTLEDYKENPEKSIEKQPTFDDKNTSGSHSASTREQDNATTKEDHNETIQEQNNGTTKEEDNATSRALDNGSMQELDVSNTNGLVAELKTTEVELNCDEIIEEKSDTKADNDAESKLTDEKVKDISPPLFSEITLAVDDEKPDLEDEQMEDADSPKESDSGIMEFRVEIGEEDEKKVETDDSQVEKHIYVNGSFADDREQSEESGESSTSDSRPAILNCTDDLACSFESSTSNDPIDILINFFYTAHIDITQKNVTTLRQLASRCRLDDVVTACDEFSKVLGEETEHMETEKEREEVASKFRYRYSDPSMPAKMLQHFADLRKQKQKTDLTLRSLNGSVFDVHALVIASGSVFFKSALSKNALEKGPLDVNDVHEDVLESLIHFLYSGRVEVNQAIVTKLIDGADRMQLDDVMEGCAEYLESTTTVQNCIPHREIAIRYNCEKLKTFIDKYISTHFIVVSNQPEFMSVSLKSLIEITSNDDLALDFPIASGEMRVFNAVKRWVNHDEDNRKERLAEAMSSVRFPLLSGEKLAHDVTTDLMIMSDSDLSRRITSVITSAPLMCFTEPVAMRGRECVLISGGSYPIDDETSEERGYQAVQYSSHFTSYDPATLRFHELTTLPQTRALHCVAACDQFVFVVGGFDPHSCIVNTVYCFDLANGSWTAMPTMKVKRACFSLHSLPGYLYAVGGLTPNGYTASVERLDRKKKVWEFASSLPTTKYRHAGCVLNGSILISGGNEKLDSVFSYDPGENVWKKEPPLNVGRNSHAMVAVKETAYAIGGEEIAFSGESFKNQVWTMIPKPTFDSFQIYFPGCSVMGNRIYVCGGWEKEDHPVYFIKYFDTVSNSWCDPNHQMPIPRGSVGSCTIRIPRNYWKMKFTSQIPKS